MSWFYRFFKKSDDEQTVTVTAPAIALTGAVTVTGALTQTGALGVTGNQSVTGNQYVSSTMRCNGGAFYLGTGTQAIVWGASSVDPINTGVSGYDKGSIYIGGTATLYLKTGYASTAWASVDLYD